MARPRSNMAKRGQAASLPGKLWSAWTKHLLSTGPTWIFVAISLTHILCCRITEVLWLRKQDFDFKQLFVTIRALKRQPQVGLCQLVSLCLHVTHGF